jgi:hypothetical protein
MIVGSVSLAAEREEDRSTGRILLGLYTAKDRS